MLVSILIGKSERCLRFLVGSDCVQQPCGRKLKAKGCTSASRSLYRDEFKRHLRIYTSYIVTEFNLANNRAVELSTFWGSMCRTYRMSDRLLLLKVVVHRSLHYSRKNQSTVVNIGFGIVLSFRNHPLPTGQLQVCGHTNQSLLETLGFALRERARARISIYETRFKRNIL